MFRTTGILALLACIFCTGGGHVLGQSLGSVLSANKTQNTDTSTKASDRLGRTTPHDAIVHFLEACHKGKYDVAAQYLDLHKLSAQHRVSQGPELAQQLGRLLDRNARFEVRALSDSPEGHLSDGLTPNVDNLATFELDGQQVVLQLERVNQPPAGLIWLVSSESVSQIPELSGLIEQNALEKHLPATLVDVTLLGTPLWVWFSLVLVAAILSAISKWLSQLFLSVAKPITRRYVKSFQAQRLEALMEPLRLLLSVIVFRACLAFITPSALLRDDLLKLLALLFMMGAAALLMRLVDVFSDNVVSRLDHRQRALTYSVFPLVIRFIKILIFSFAALVVLQQWGYNTNTILAGLGVGGIAVALAAQKTIENLFGGVSLISDRAVLVGDFCQFGGQVGTVEDIGLRSTRIRTLDRTVVTVPNSQFSTMTLENYSKRDRMWFHPTIRLRRDTSPDQIRQMMEEITQILQNHEMVDSSGVPLRFSKITDQTLDLDIFAYVLTPDSNQFLRVQTELLLKVLEASYRLGIGLAVPIQEEYNVSVDARQKEPAHPVLAYRRQDDVASHEAESSTREPAQVR